MIYCKNCARILDEELSKCPYCGAEDENDKNLVDRKMDGDHLFIVESEMKKDLKEEVEKEFEEAKEIIAENQSGEVVDTNILEIDELLGKKNERVEIAEIIDTNEAPYTERPKFQNNMKEKEEMPTGIGVKIAISIGALIFPLIGVIAGIIFALKKNKSDRLFGIIILVVSGLFMLLGFMFLMMIFNLAMSV